MFAPLSERAFLAPGGELDLIFLPVGHFRPLSPLLTAECGARRWQAELQANELVGRPHSCIALGSQTGACLCPENVSLLESRVIRHWLP